jgi:hypothetical protein
VSEERFFRWLCLTAVSVAGVSFAAMFVSICVLFTLKVWQEIWEMMGGGA